ncbi:MAG: MBL fold metallo-hydrolase [Minisyncoccia bacterium]
MDSLENILYSFFTLPFIFGYHVNRSLTSVGHKGPVSEHFDGKRFWNIGEREGLLPTQAHVAPRHHTKNRSLFEWMLHHKKHAWSPSTVPEVSVPERSEELLITVINHSTVLIQMHGMNIITDPIYSKRASPYKFIGPLRFVNPRITLENLPPIDLLLLSHNHYDHMDMDTLRHIAKTHNPHIVTGLGNKEYLRHRGVTRVKEAEWFETHSFIIGKTAVHIDLVPAQHFSARSLSDKNKTLWGGFVIRAHDKKIYMAGDSGYGPFVKKIAERYPSGFTVGLLPIGAYMPESYMRRVHMNPREALQIMKDLQIQKGIAIHFGTFPLADDTQREPLEDLADALQSDEFAGLHFEVQK